MALELGGGSSCSVAPKVNSTNLVPTLFARLRKFLGVVGIGGARVHSRARYRLIIMLTINIFLNTLQCLTLFPLFNCITVLASAHLLQVHAVVPASQLRQPILINIL